MTDERFKLIYSGLADDTNEETARTMIHERFQLPFATIDAWLGKPRALIRADLNKDQAWKTQYLLESIGVHTQLVQQTRSNLSLQAMQLESMADQPKVTVQRYQPSGVAEFAAKPLASGRRASLPANRRRSAPQNSAPKSFKLTHIIAAAVMVVVLSYVGKQAMQSTAEEPSIASWSEVN